MPFTPEAHRWRCVPCKTTMSTDNLTVGLEELWQAAHAGHETVEEHPLFESAHRPEPQSPMDEYLARMSEL